jgi:membrane-associated protease RseP (regulator of RpoE activity)
VLGYIGVGVGFLGMAGIVYLLGDGVYSLFYRPEAPPTIAPVLPGVDYPGMPFDIPLINGFLALFFVVVIHEFSHGVVARAHDIPVKSSGYGFMAIVPIAFVEPDEEATKEAPMKAQHSLFAAGPFSNVVTGVIAMLLVGLVLLPAMSSYMQPEGVSFEVIPDTSAARNDLPSGVTFTMFNGEEMQSASDFIQLAGNLSKGEEVTFSNAEQDVTIPVGSNPNNESQAYIGVRAQTEFSNDDTFLGFILLELRSLLNLFIILSFGLGLANLIPAGPIDGGRMFLLVCQRFFDEERAEWVWTKVSIALLAVIVVLLIDAVVITPLQGTFENWLGP